MSEKKPLGFFNTNGDFDAEALVESIKNAQKEHDIKTDQDSSQKK